MPQKRKLFLLLTLALLPVLALAGRPKYQYGECWWKEYRYHEDTQLLFHFGAPQVSAREELAGKIKEAREKKEEVKNLFSEGLENEGPDVETKLDPEAYRKGPEIDPSKVPENGVQDYAHPKRRLRLPTGMEKVEDGRFGKGLRCTGGKGLTFRPSAPNSVEMSFRISRHPQQTQCLWSVNDDEARLLLHPDGRLEFRLKEPHGHPGGYPGHDEPVTEAERKAIMARDAEIISEEAVPLNQWVHVRVYRHPHPTPGGGEPWDARLVIDGDVADSYLSERYNRYEFFGRRETKIVLGNSATGDQGFEGLVDEFRLLGRYRKFYQRPAMPWRDSGHELQFDRPWFRNESTVFRAPLGEQRDYTINRADSDPIRLDLDAGDPSGLEVPGVRGKGWVMDPDIGFPKFPIKGLDAMQGSLEFWVRPVNWDDCTGYWSHTPPRHMHLTVARFFGRDSRDGKVKPFMSFQLPRAHNRERSRMPLDPGHWCHVVASWSQGNLKWGGLRIDPVGAREHRKGFRRKTDLIRHIEPLYVQFGIPDDVEVKWRQKPRIEIDEVIGYRLPLARDEQEQALERWRGRLETIPLYTDRLHFKWSLQKLEYTWRPRLPRGQSVSEVTLALERKRADGWEKVGGSRTVRVEKGKAHAVLHRKTELPEDLYRVDFVARNSEGRKVLHGSREWNYEEEEWRGYDGGILEEPPAPWTPIDIDGNDFSTRMTSYRLAQNGLPAQIVADGKELLAEPVRFSQNGENMEAEDYSMTETTPTKARWVTVLRGPSADVKMSCRMEYDGMIRYELDVKPKQKIDSLRFEIPLKSERATRYLYYPMGSRGVKTGVIQPKMERILDSRVDPVSWRAYKRARKKNKNLSWSDYRQQLLQNKRGYRFYGHVDVHDMERGLFWFTDNAAGWHQSKENSAIRLIRREDGAVVLQLNLVAEPVKYAEKRPIVFAIIPHPARPMPDKYRLYDRVTPEKDDMACSVFDAFRPWPMNPKAGTMKIYPKNHSWEYAESCVPIMKSAKPVGYRTMYLSLKWMSCRAGAYDHWEWRSGQRGAVSLTPSFVDYLCWEMNEWIGRDIFNAVYLDEAYEEPLRNLEAGMSVKLPDGSEQPGVDNFRFRELMKRWYGLFATHDKTPMLLAHHTYSFQYPGLLYTQAYLDGENAPIVSLKSRDWIGSTSKHRFETIQNGQLWGMTPFYMPYISEGGFSSEKDEFPVWQWRMARQAQSQFAHYEVATVYEGQGSGVYKKYWSDVLGWTASDPDDVPFRPYWNNGEFLQVDGQGDHTLVSFYQKPQKILLIASNRQKQKRIVRIELDADRLGLSSPLSVRHLDSSFERPPGKDYRPHTEETEEETEKLLESEGDLLGGDGGEETAEEMLLGDEGMEKKKREGLRPRLEGNVLILPIRPRDFRMVEVK